MKIKVSLESLHFFKCFQYIEKIYLEKILKIVRNYSTICTGN